MLALNNLTELFGPEIKKKKMSAQDKQAAREMFCSILFERVYIFCPRAPARRLYY